MDEQLQGKPEDTPLPSVEARNMAMLAHLLGLIGFIGPLIIWLLKKDEDPYIDDQGKEALNFQLLLMIGWVVAFLASFLCIGVLFIPVLFVIQIVFPIIGAMKGSKGVRYRYPLNLRLVQ